MKPFLLGEKKEEYRGNRRNRVFAEEEEKKIK
jgi:hypothetical protein